MLIPSIARNDDSTERDSLVLLVGQIGPHGRALANALHRAGYAIQWETSIAALTEAAREMPPAAVLAECAPGGDPFGIVRWLRAQREYSHSLVFAVSTGAETLPIGEGIASGADDVINMPSSVEDILDRVSARIARARTLEERAFYDCVTHVRNRLFMRERLPGELSRALRRHGRASIALLEVDGVEALRRDKGRTTADRALELFAFTMRSSLRDADLACRFDERTFVVLMPGLDAKTSAVSLASVNDRVGERLRELGGVRLTHVPALAEAPRDGTSWERLLEAAERRMKTPRPSSTTIPLSPVP